ncbi:cation transporter [Geobacter sp. DSM 9736]|uniref:cation transporter n=1 Tax=Geobacter sp. DSM 9736 TaxID=1277350 RepID=UPI000B512DC2|nr:cation transporter [Geobacter sp. DSM 9736]SNB46122.1 Cation efflux family protein [Geobacter sp. DSM 9736]
MRSEGEQKLKAGGDADCLWRQANLLAVITIVYNIGEGAVSVWFGIADETLSLFGFGVDSFVEVMSGIGIWHMIRRIRSSGGESRDRFERGALTVTGWAFFILAGGLGLSALLSLFQYHHPESTLWGVVVSAVSISFMWLLIRFKTKVGRALGSDAILADAACSRACLYLSLALLAASLGYTLTGIGWFDSAGAILIGSLAAREGVESFRKRKGLACGCSGTCSNA